MRFRLTSLRLGRVLLLSSLMSSALLKSTAGEALVLHQHGVRSVHLHTLGFSELPWDAAWSSRFGHGSHSEFVLQSTPERVRVLAIVSIGVVFVSTSGHSCDEATHLVSAHDDFRASVADSQAPPVVEGSVVASPAWIGRTASAILLLRNHAFLI